MSTLDHASAKKELVTHAVVSALAATIVVGLEMGIQRWIHEWAGNYAALVVLAATFVVAFTILYFFEAARERHFQRLAAARERRLRELADEEERKPILIGDIGDISGTWVDVVSYRANNASPAEGTIMQIQGTRGTGLKISGEAFDPDALNSCGEFATTTTFVEGNSLIYHYKGSKGNQHDDGVGFYRFWTDSSHHLRLEGAFLALSLKQQVRFVRGRRLRESEHGDVEQALRAHLESHRRGADADGRTNP